MSGLGTTLIQSIFSKFRRHETPNEKNDTQPQYIEQELSTRQQDILAIQKSINFDLSSQQAQIYFRYLNKYKNKFITEDVNALNEQSSTFLPNYSILLSKLLGLIESIEE